MTCAMRNKSYSRDGASFCNIASGNAVLFGLSKGFALSNRYKWPWLPFVTLKGRAKGQGEFGDFGDSVKLMLVKLKHSPSNLMESNIGWASCLKWDLTRDQSFEWQL